MSRFCAICTSTVGPFTREPLGKDDALVDACAKCVSEVVVPVDPALGRRGQVLHDEDSEYGSMTRAERIKAHRKKLHDAGLCANGAAHSKPIHGRTHCEECRDRDRTRTTKRSA